MPFWFIADSLDLLISIGGKNSQTVIKEVVANVFRAAIMVNSSELADLFYFYIIKLGPEYEAKETMVGEGMLVKAVARVCG